MMQNSNTTANVQSSTEDQVESDLQAALAGVASMLNRY